MSKKTTLTIYDEVNIKFEKLDTVTRRKLVNSLKFFLPHARHTPAYKLGRWDGTISLATSGGRTYLNLLDFKTDSPGAKTPLEIVMDAGYEVEINDLRQEHDIGFKEITETYFSERGYVWPKGHTHEGELITLKEHQVDAINTFLKNPQCIQQISTGAGKTIVTAALSQLTEHLGRSIVIVPNKDLVTQTEEDFINLGLDVGVFYGERKEWDKTHTICTWQSLSILDKNSKNKLVMTDQEIDDFKEGIVTVIVDEVHSAKGTELKNLLTNVFNDCPIRWGLTGTVPKETHEFINILATLGPVVNNINAKDLQDKDILANCHVSILQLEDNIVFSDYHAEAKFLSSDKTRMEHIAGTIADIAESGNTLVLVNSIKSGEMLRDMLPESVFVNGRVKSKDRKETYSEISIENEKIIVATYGVASTGINIPRIFNLVIIESGKSFVRVIQSIGRGLRKAKDKDFVNIWDITSNCKFSKRHLAKRKAFYQEAKYDYTVTKVKYK